MKAYKYVVKVCEDMTHGWERDIYEVGVPELGIIINYSGVHFIGKEEVDARMVGSTSNEEDKEFEINDDAIIKIAQEFEEIKDIENDIANRKKSLQPYVDKLLEDFNLQDIRNYQLNMPIDVETGVTTSHNVCTNFYEWKGTGKDEGES